MVLLGFGCLIACRCRLLLVYGLVVSLLSASL